MAARWLCGSSGDRHGRGSVFWFRRNGSNSLRTARRATRRRLAQSPRASGRGRRRPRKSRPKRARFPLRAGRARHSAAMGCTQRGDTRLRCTRVRAAYSGWTAAAKRHGRNAAVPARTKPRDGPDSMDRRSGSSERVIPRSRITMSAFLSIGARPVDSSHVGRKSWHACTKLSLKLRSRDGRCPSRRQLRRACQRGPPDACRVSHRRTGTPSACAPS